ncbi:MULTISPECIES: lateral flagellin LafA [Pseudomonadaceae]|uniref:Flagellin n=1 Tax=Pseudomonas denitrificans TaxID=43306 RepID=A0A9X7N4B0_PSEDE|nr:MULTISPECIES: lateral flagellin LafA [Pseudomonadaceae]MBD9514726.1 lateral flagellin LafA [Pseudomonas sp. PDM22]MBD9685588.1 lateral flagellin LafA [Pseudomonas sp. PDM20]OQR31947.1 Lateral flagellin [Pseudomonas sp. T]QEY74763.1 Lateral flagellin [Pseudomonas denitrificans (nom. rej.)]
MALSIQTNYSSLITQTSLSKTNGQLATSQQRLGTGLRINSAADDAAGLQIATRLNAQTRGMNMAMRNTSDAVSMLQTGEGAFSEATDILQRMKDLATQSANGTNSDKDLDALKSEFDELGKELTNIVTNTKYAGDSLFGTGGKLAADIKFQIGSDSAEVMTVAAADTDIAATVTALGTTVQALDPKAGAAAAIDGLNDALDQVGKTRAAFGAAINRLGHTSNNLANMKDNTDMAKGRIMDADFASETANMTKSSMLMQSGISMLKQAGQMPSMIMGLLG